MPEHTHTTKLLYSPAKINWFLHVTSRREDGFHLLESVFQRVDWCDEVRILVSDNGAVLLDGDLSGVIAERNLAHRAAVALKHFAAQHNIETAHLGATIHLTKRIPTGAGLGGGSSNAATVLVALNDLWALGLSNGVLQNIGLTLGADVPFFVSGFAAAFASGVGEVLDEVVFPPREVLLVNPNVHVATRAVFEHSSMIRDHAPLDVPLDALTAQLREQPIHPDHNNDLQTATFAIAPGVKTAFDALAHFAPTRMSGSGATLICCPKTSAQREALVLWLKTAPPSWQTRWTQTLP